MDTLLHKINLLIQEEKVIKREKEMRGENFNIFEIMHAQSDEVYTHSAFLASLLNPNGNHGSKSAFLKTFIENIIEQQKESFSQINFNENLDTYLTYIEYSIGKVSKDYETGGRIDIVIESKKHDKAIIIENKIYADDQPKQLYRYKNYADEKYGLGNYYLVYLTLDGHEPCKESISGNKFTMKEGQDFFRLSYQSFILDWLLICKEKATSNPIVRETITQYYNLIAKLTNKNMESSIKEKLIDMLANENNIASVFKIHSVYYDVLNKACNTTLLEQINEIAEELEIESICSFQNWNQRWAHFFFSLPKWKHFCIGFEFMSNDLKDFNYGIRYKTESDKECFPEIKKMIGEKLGGKSNSWWASIKPFKKYSDWNNESVFEHLYDGTIKSEIKKTVSDLLSLTEEIEL